MCHTPDRTIRAIQVDGRQMTNNLTYVDKGEDLNKHYLYLDFQVNNNNNNNLVILHIL